MKRNEGMREVNDGHLTRSLYDRIGLQLVCDNGFLSVKDFRTNPKRIFAAHEMVGLVDGSTATKMTVQVG